MTDKREYIKLDIGYLSNPKIAGLLVGRRPLAVLLHVECMTYSRQHRTDGVVPSALALRGVVGATKRDLSAAIDAGLLVDLGGGLLEVHDYLDHQESKAAIEARSAAAVKANSVRWSGSERGRSSDSESESESGSRPVRNPEERRGEEKEDASHLRAPADADGAPPKPSRRSPERPLPDSWAPKDNHRAYATEHRLDIDREAETFRNHAATHDRRARNWDAAFRTWLTKAKPTQPTHEPRSAWDRLPNITEERLRRERERGGDGAA